MWASSIHKERGGRGPIQISFHFVLPIYSAQENTWHLHSSQTADISKHEPFPVLWPPAARGSGARLTNGAFKPSCRNCISPPSLARVLLLAPCLHKTSMLRMLQWAVGSYSSGGGKVLLALCVWVPLACDENIGLWLEGYQYIATRALTPILITLSASTHARTEKW